MAKLLKAFLQNVLRSCFEVWKVHMGQCMASDANFFVGVNM